MSGRDFRSFLASHKAEIGKDSRMVTCIVSGQKPTYKQNDYNELYALVNIKRSSGNHALKKIEKLSKKSIDYKERQLSQEHKSIWEKEMHKLIQCQEKVENELTLLIPNYELSLNSSERLYEEIIDLDESIKYERNQFIKQTLDPVRDLKMDVDEWIKVNRNQLVLGVHNERNEDDVLSVIQSVKQQQQDILAQLLKEKEELEHEHALLFGKVKLYLINLSLPPIEVGAPEAVLTLSCPDEELLKSCIENFNKLDEQYLCELEDLETKYEAVVQKAPYGGWSADEYLHFKHIMKQYQDITKNRRKLYLHRLQKEMNQRTREQLVKYEEWCFKYKSFQSQTKDLVHAWKRDKEDLKLRTISWCQEATQQYNEKRQNIMDRMTQKFVCNYLHEKVLEYQRERLELMKLEAEFRSEEEQQEEEKRKAKESKDTLRRQLDKEKIRIYKESQERLSGKRRENDHRRMLELQEKQAEERHYHMERVKYRDILYQEKLESIEERKREELFQEEEKEKRLKALRDQVEKNVEDNPDRLYEPTESYKARLAAAYDEELESQTPLFRTCTYSVDQVAQDRRLKVENAFRRANLHMSEYAREVIKTIPPPTNPRRDNISTVFSN